MFLWASFSVALASLALIIQAHYLYRPGFWELWWLWSVWLRALGLGLLPGLALAGLCVLLPGLSARVSTAVAAGAYLAAIPGLFGLGWTLAGLALGLAAGFIWPVKEWKGLAVIHLLGTGLTLFTLAHGKALLLG